MRLLTKCNNRTSEVVTEIEVAIKTTEEIDKLTNIKWVEDIKDHHRA